MKYYLGLDLGIAFVGWSVIELNSQQLQPIAVRNIGIRVFTKAESAKDGSSLASARRKHRGKKANKTEKIQATKNQRVIS